MTLWSDIVSFSLFGNKYSAILMHEYFISVPLLPLFSNKYCRAFSLIEWFKTCLNLLIFIVLISFRVKLIFRNFRFSKQLETQSPFTGFSDWTCMNLYYTVDFLGFHGGYFSEIIGDVWIFQTLQVCDLPPNTAEILGTLLRFWRFFSKIFLQFALVLLILFLLNYNKFQIRRECYF